MPRTFYKDTVTRLRHPLIESARGGLKRDTTVTERLVIDGVKMQPLTASEVEQRPTVSHRLRGPLLIDLEPDDVIEHIDLLGRTRTYDVIGEPMRYQSPHGAASHSQTELKGTDQ